jgi:hypothetical protein
MAYAPSVGSLAYRRIGIYLAPKALEGQLMADTVAKVFCWLWRATLILNGEQQRNFDSLHQQI